MMRSSIKSRGMVFAAALGFAALGAGVNVAHADDQSPSSRDDSVPSATTTRVTPHGTTTVTPHGTTTTTPDGTTTTTTPSGTTTTTTTPPPVDTSGAMPSPGDTTTTTTTTPGSSSEAPTVNTTIVEPAPPAPVEHNNTIVLQPPAAPPPPAPVEPLPAPRYHPAGAGLMVGGGAVDFSRDTARGSTDTGGYWNVRAIFGTRQYLGLEAAYVGSAQGINVLGLSSNASLVSNGAEGALRLNIPIKMNRDMSLVEPFGFVGAGWSRYQVVNSSTATSSISDNDDVLTVPFGAGLAVGHRGFFADGRFTYRPTYYNDLFRVSSGGSARLDNWSAGAQLGFEF